MNKVLQEIENERERQITEEGYHPKDDDVFNDQEQLAYAASVYAMGANLTYTGIPIETIVWPWANEPKWSDSRRRDLIKAAALLVAEIERIDRNS